MYSMEHKYMYMYSMEHKYMYMYSMVNTCTCTQWNMYNDTSVCESIWKCVIMKTRNCLSVFSPYIILYIYTQLYISTITSITI